MLFAHKASKFREREHESRDVLRLSRSLGERPGQSFVVVSLLLVLVVPLFKAKDVGVKI